MNSGLPFDTGRSAEGEPVLTFRTSLTYEHAALIWKSLNSFIREGDFSGLVLSLAEVDKVDGSGIALLQSAERLCKRRGIRFHLESVPFSAQHLLDYFQRSESEEPPSPAAGRLSLISRLGLFSLEHTTDLFQFFRFAKTFFSAAVRCLRHFRKFHWGEVFFYLEAAGANAMVILFLISFLLGLVMAYQAAIQLRQFGANIYVADLVSLALARELAPVFTGMLLAGRSGSAFAAEIGTMKVGEEIDALAVMGFNLTEYVTVPKVFALMIAAPLLTMWADFGGILGAVAVAGASLDLTPYSFMHEVYTAIAVSDIVSGLIKTEIFAVFVALIGCFRGFQTDAAADSVGRQTTSAVVSGLFLIILTDAFLTIFFHAFGW